MRLHGTGTKVLGAILFLLCCSAPFSAFAAGTRTIGGHVPPVALRTQWLGRMPATNAVRLALTLPLSNADGLSNFLQRLYDPNSPDYHRYVNPSQFREKFGPAALDYQAIIQFAASNGLRVVANHDSRMLVDVEGRAADVEKAFHVQLHVYQHPVENRHFYAPNVEPTVDAALPVLDIIGLDSVARPRSSVQHRPVNAKSQPASGSQAGGSFLGRDFRNAYAPGVNLTGAGQMVGLLELDGFYSNDIVSYEASAGFTNVPLQTLLFNGATGTPGAAVDEVSLDIEMAIAMAPGLAGVIVYEGANVGNGTTSWIDILDAMTANTQVSQFSSSWGYTGSPDPNTSFDAQFMKMAAQGQSFFEASGDGDAWINPIWTPADSPYVTSVGGTTLSMTGAGAAYLSENVWNYGDEGTGNGWSPNENTGLRHTVNNFIGSGGGVSTVYSIPTWQKGAINTTNKGSTTRRNVPDVALTGDNIWVVTGNGQTKALAGTSCAAPLWAGFTALINQQAAAGGSATVGFINPALYATVGTAGYATNFHDIITGNNSNTWSANLYLATPQFDLCTGLGTPNGSNLINTLSPEPLQITPAPVGASGPAGGPFNLPQNIVLTNTAPAPLNWALASSSPWFAISPANGTLLAGSPATVLNVTFTPAASNLSAGNYTAAIVFSNLNDTVTQGRTFVLTVTKNLPAVTWANPAGIGYGSALSTNQLNANANVSGTFIYSPAAGTVLGAGAQPLSVVFIPADTSDYSTVTNNVSVTVSPSSLSVTANNASRPYAAANPALGGTILGLQNSDNISATYSSSASLASPVGLYPIVSTLSDPANRLTNYNLTLSNGTLAVLMAAPGVGWATPSNIAYGTALGSNQLDATANVPGSFSYMPSSGAIPAPGTNLLSVLFTPSDAVDFSTATNSVSLVVSLAPIALGIQLAGSNAILTWTDPAAVFSLQSAPALDAVFTNVPGAASPSTNALTSGQQFFRLISN